MKKQILALSLGLMTIGVLAQKNELKVAEKALKKNDIATARTAIQSIESMESSMEDKYKAKYYFLKGQVYGKTDVNKAVEAYNSLFDYEKATKKSRYTPLAKTKVMELTQFVSQKAVTAYNETKDYKTATENFYLTYQLSPTDTSFLYNAAVSASLQKDYDTSLKYYNKLQELGYTGITMQYMATNKETGAQENLGGKTQRDLMVKSGDYEAPQDVPTASRQSDIVKNIGYILIAQGKTDEAIVAIKKARENDPKDLNLLLNEAQLYIQLKDMEKFGTLMEEAIQLDPENPTLFFNLGVVNQNEGKKEEAIGYYKKAIELDPEYGDAYMNLAVAILSGEQAIVDEMNENLSNFKKYDELQGKQKELYKEALPFLEKADSIKRSEDTVKSLLNIYDILRMEDKADALRPIYKKMRGM
ncbi:tetratricopeptide repeat protein [Polaribacter dokdonensis]|uniref:Tetratricopeptide repeat family protein n=1 Tax=Polaribacter dokdonensis DSW-5 TaxID=1300348 RepID=A0A0M9CE19_9FLAO|nr:tetratricopeptide repeat protein [Polaribacter dokdonensis]KOY50486.1 Tetratricopeptide repeat family protein [Polaribacter dokdonensis DSW-5]SEE59487.1 Tetratricopeptide repeat-containing protein [Polaribacter dokdonensis DSW-5]